ncbi:MAG TPA: dihydropteroate synthase [Gemmataceae bacterium]|jgi:dihydropteroate synthase|nr:dihydropteroate synthase [Gemmataceae bacterium]
MTHQWQLTDRVLVIERRPLVMGIVNVTPDSFSDGGKYANADAAVARGLELVRQGADILDIGGESTRPGALPVSLEEELRRVVPVIQALTRQTAVPLSVDTSKAEVARQSLSAGAHVLNDVTAMTGDPEMADIVRKSKAGVILMHMKGTPATMQQDPQYDDPVDEIGHYFEERLEFAAKVGIAREQMVLDPGIGFGKTSDHNLEILARLEKFQKFNRPVCLGVSRKGFVGRLLNNRPAERRLAGSLAAVAYAMTRRAVQIVRVHDVEETRDVVNVIAAIQQKE